ncbi:anti-sigma factor family protein [Rhodohalobacter sulfatireducens]|uniref:Zf-HC2 domain-containing protein n=1 Tax=Rhodohalobacter sulfatireducens TaxID=2911366 RepID=A0ABS9KDR2_9BACT|nr:zf-HC2 domain-containing protein [Rhodohalobacter sulfatireducens]MCG2588952.1 zf-HC2 domain-containing protein [Rhodohalobacter sulfatireducens]
MMSNRNHVKKYFLDWLEGHLDEDKEKEINRHLKQCESCHSYFQTMQIIMEEPSPERLPDLKRDPYLPVRIKQKAFKSSEQDSVSIFGLSKALTGSLVVLGLLLGFLTGQLLVYHTETSQDVSEQTSVSELYYEGMVQPSLGSNFEQVLTEMEGDQQ